MLKCALALGLMVGLCGFAHAQDVPRVEVFGGYSYVNADTNGLTSRQSANGWEASISGNIDRWFAVEGDFSGYYKTYGLDLASLGLGTVNVNVRDFGFMGGPRVNFRPVFVHALVGVDDLTGDALGLSASQDSFAAAFGGGVQQKVAPRWAVRASADYVLTHHNIFKVIEPLAPTATQNNFRVSVGIVFTFGGTHEVVSRTVRRKAGSASVGEAALLGVFGNASDNGFAVTSVRAGSAAAQAGIEPGDIVTAIDARPVHTSGDIESAIATSQTGTIRVSFLVKGAWLTEKDVKVR